MIWCKSPYRINRTCFRCDRLEECSTYESILGRMHLNVLRIIDHESRIEDLRQLNRSLKSNLPYAWSVYDEENWKVPMNPDRERYLKNRVLVHEMFDAGMSMNRIAKELKTAWITVSNMLSGKDPQWYKRLVKNQAEFNLAMRKKPNRRHRKRISKHTTGGNKDG